MNREEIELSEHILRSLLDEDYDGWIEDEDLGYIIEDEILTDTDMEKGIEWKDIIVKRNSDRKLFKFHLVDSYYNPIFDNYEFPFKLKEVFIKQITKTIYE